MNLPPADDPQCVRLLHELQVIDFGQDPGLEALVRVAALQAGCPVGALTLVGADGPAFEVAHGADLAGQPDPFCLLGLPLHVRPDTGDARWRFYACVPVRVGAQDVGALCVLAPEPRDGLPPGVGEAFAHLTRAAGALLEARLTERRAAELATVTKSEFLSRMSHEMRTPLNAVIGFAQLLLNRPGEAAVSEVRDYAEHVLRAGEHLLALTNDVLDLQHVEEGRADIDSADVPLDGLVAQVLALQAADAEQRGVRFDNHVPPQIAVRADERRLRQVLGNIVSNAVKYNRPAGTVRLSVDADTDGGRVRLDVEDSGSGLKPEQLERLFQPFERLGKETSTIQGTGLGLIIARTLTVAMGGTLQVASRAGIGTRVVLELPLAQQAPLPFAEPAAPRATEPAGAPPTTLRMLYVEDNRINAILFEEALRLREGVELRLAEDGAEAMEQVRDWTPDVLVLDAHLPGMDGFELLQALRERPGLAQVPAFMCSADAMPDDVQRAADAGFAGYWSKPINIARILEDLDRLGDVRAPAGADPSAGGR